MAAAASGGRRLRRHSRGLDCYISTAATAQRASEADGGGATGCCCDGGGEVSSSR